jgi:hypothetical protein
MTGSTLEILKALCIDVARLDLQLTDMVEEMRRLAHDIEVRLRALEGNNTQ